MEITMSPLLAVNDPEPDTDDDDEKPLTDGDEDGDEESPLAS
jgi:hypothetical protein